MQKRVLGKGCLLERLFTDNGSMKKAALYYGSTASPTIVGVRGQQVVM